MNPKKQFLNDDVLREIFLKLADTNDLTGEYANTGLRDLYHCIFVCRQWCRVSIPILWGQPFHFLKFSDDETIPRTSDKILDIYFRFLSEGEKQDLLNKGIDISLVTPANQQGIYFDDENDENDENNKDEEGGGGEGGKSSCERENDCNAVDRKEPMFNYPMFLRSLSYMNLISAVMVWCEDLECIMKQQYGENSELTEDAEYLVLHTILKLCFNKGARLSSLNIIILDITFRDVSKTTHAIQKCFVDDELKEFFVQIRSLEFNCMFSKVTRDILSTLSQTCHQLVRFEFKSLVFKK